MPLPPLQFFKFSGPIPDGNRGMNSVAVTPPSVAPRPAVPLPAPLPPPITAPHRPMIPLSDESRRGPAVALFLAVNFLLTWGSYALHYFEMVPPPLDIVLWIIGAVGPTAGALAATLFVLRRRFPGLDLDPKVEGWRSYLVALGVPVAIAILASLVNWLADPNPSRTGYLSADVVGMFYFFVVLALLEEIGWRGFLTPILARRGRLVSSVVTGLVWGVWHVPWMIGSYHLSFVDISLFIVMTVLGAISLSVLTSRSGSVGPAIVAHAAWNLVVASGFFFVAREEDVVYTIMIFALTAVTAVVSLFIADRKRLPHRSPQARAAASRPEPGLAGAPS